MAGSGVWRRSIIAVWSILSKDVHTYYLKPPNISWGIIFPIAWTLMFFLRAEQAMDVQSILPGVMSLSILFGTTSMLAVTVTFEKRSRSFERLLLAPISLNLLMLAKTSGAILFGIGNASVPLILALLWDRTLVLEWLPLMLGVVLLAVTSTFLGFFIAVSVREVFEAQTFSNFFRFPMLFLCGLFIPIAQLPLFLQPLSYALPLTYGVDILRQAVTGDGILSYYFSFPILTAFALGLFFLSVRNVNRKWIL